MFIHNTRYFIWSQNWPSSRLSINNCKNSVLGYQNITLWHHYTWQEECTDFPKICDTSQNSRRQNGYMNFHTKVPQISGVTVQNLVVRLTWRSGFVHLCIRQLFLPLMMTADDRHSWIALQIPYRRDFLDQFLQCFLCLIQSPAGHQMESRTARRSRRSMLIQVSLWGRGYESWRSLQWADPTPNV